MIPLRIADCGLRIGEMAGTEVEPIWCVVANVSAKIPIGPKGKEIQKGTKHFVAGTKVYCFPPLWGDGYEMIKIVGRHRGSHRYVTMVVARKTLTNWRVKLVYSRYVVREMKGKWDGTPDSQIKATELVNSILGIPPTVEKKSWGEMISHWFKPKS